MSNDKYPKSQYKVIYRDIDNDVMNGHNIEYVIDHLREKSKGILKPKLTYYSSDDCVSFELQGFELMTPKEQVDYVASERVRHEKQLQYELQNIDREKTLLKELLAKYGNIT